MTVLARSNTSLLGQWWWTVDRPTLAAIGALIVIGILMSFASSPDAALRYGVTNFHFAWRQLAFLVLAVGLMTAVSLLSPRGVLALSAATLAVAAALVVVTLVVNAQVQGASRWIRLGFVALQPSEFVTPSFAVVAAALFSACRLGTLRSGNLVSVGLFAFLVLLLAQQPDVGMAVVVALVWTGQFFLAGLRFVTTAVLVLCGVAVMAGAYATLPHVKKRIDSFRDPQAADTYQIDKSLEAFRHGGLFGRGPGEGVVKRGLPDAHSDFVFAVAGEELGAAFCLAVVALFAFIVLRSLLRILREADLFVLVAGGGLIVMFGAQAAINMGSALHLIPTKGMTLPLVSYGGSSLVATALGMGFLLALTRRRPQPLEVS